MSLLQKLLPREASNDYRGSPIALYAFWLLMLPFTFRSLVHFLKDDSGAHSIATIVRFAGTPDPNQVIYMYSALWGSQQLLMLGLYFVVLLRYRNLLPLMYVVMILESLFRMTVGMLHPLTAEHFVRTPPGVYATWGLPLLAAVLLLLSLRTRPGVAESAGTG